MNSRSRAKSQEPQNQGHNQSSKPLILIVCGGKTEEHYFSGLGHWFNLTNVTVSFQKPRARDILARVQEKIEAGPSWDEIYCVLDVDDHHAEVKRLQFALAGLSRKNLRARAVLSNPCFEYWLLLHFEYTDAPFVSMPGGKTAAQQVIERLCNHIRNYSKTDSGIFDYCREHIGAAVERAHGRRVPHEGRAPATEVGALVEHLIRLAEE